MFVTVTLNPALDHVMQLDALRPGRTNRSHGERLQPGGKGINVAVVLCRLGADVAAWGFIAGFTGRVIADGVAALGVKTAFITLPQGMSRINVKLKAEQETEINAAGPAVDDGSLQALLRQTDTLQAGDQLVLSGSLPAGLPRDLYRTVCRRAAARGVSVTVDATGALLTDALEARPFLIKPNRDELAEIAGRPLPDDAAVAAAAADLQRRGRGRCWCRWAATALFCWMRPARSTGPPPPPDGCLIR